MRLRLAEDLALPLDTVTSTLVVYGGKGMGKTNLGSVLMEELARAGLRFAVVDPMGVWWGLRHDKGGKGKGIEVLILGGTHADIPIEPTAGAVVADLVVDESVNVVIDISRRPDGTMWSIGERVRFVTDYAKRLYQRQGERRRPLFQVIDEAARFIPQTIRKGDDQVAFCMAAVAVLVEEGRNVGIGVCLITQRSARLNKDVAELADCMVAFRTVGPNSRRAVLDWLGEHIEKDRLKDLDLAVRSLPIGSALVVSPGWLEVEKVVAVRARETFDSSRTPKAGEHEARVSGEGAKPDLEKYTQRMAATIERAKAEDPRELRRQLQERDREITKLRNAKSAPSTAKVVERRVEVPILKDAQITRLDSFGGKLLQAAEAYAVAGQRGVAIATDLRVFGQELAAAIRTAKNGSQAPPVPVRPMYHKVIRAAQTSARTAPAAGDLAITVPQQRILDALAWFEAVGLPAPEKAPLAAMADASSRSSAYQNNVSALRTAGLVDYPRSGLVALTESGRARATPPDVPGTTAALQDAVLAKVTRPQARILQAVIEVYPRALTKEELADRAEASAASSAFQNNVSAMRSLGLVDYPAAGQVVALPVLFLEEARR
jgi:hypothetical protein